MSAATLFFISSGLFLGWSLGANHAVNVFGTAVMSKMVRFRVAAIVAGVFVILGAVVSGAGATRTLNQLGAVNALAGSFTVALAVALAVTWMTQLRLPVSTSQAIVGGIIGWNLFTGSPTDLQVIAKILGTWVTSPILAGLFAFGLFKLLEGLLRRVKIHLLEIDAYTRAGLIVVGALASYALGANNIANVMGLFVSATPFNDVVAGNVTLLTGTQQLFLLGGFAIAVGIFTYGQKVMVTVGSDLYRITPLSGLVVVLAQFLVLFLFSSETLESFLRAMHLPTIPLVPLSSTQAVIGAVVGVGFAKQGRGVNLHVLGKIVAGWLTAPLVAFVMAFSLLFFVQNVFEQRVVADAKYYVSPSVIMAAAAEGIPIEDAQPLVGRNYSSVLQFRNALQEAGSLTRADINAFLRLARLDSLRVDSTATTSVLGPASAPPEFIAGLRRFHGRIYRHRADLEFAIGTAEVRVDSSTVRIWESLDLRLRDALVDRWRLRPSPSQAR